MKCEACKYYSTDHQGNSCDKLQLENFHTFENCSEGETILEKDLRKSHWYLYALSLIDNDLIRQFGWNSNTNTLHILTDEANASIILKGEGFDVKVSNGWVYAREEK